MVTNVNYLSVLNENSLELNVSRVLEEVLLLLFLFNQCPLVRRRITFVCLTKFSWQIKIDKKCQLVAAGAHSPVLYRGQDLKTNDTHPRHCPPAYLVVRICLVE